MRLISIFQFERKISGIIPGGWYRRRKRLSFIFYHLNKAQKPLGVYLIGKNE
jgi:hypothetical protein